MSKPVALYNEDQLGDHMPQGGQVQSASVPTNGEYYTLGRREFSVQNLHASGNYEELQPYREERSAEKDSKFELGEI